LKSCVDFIISEIGDKKNIETGGVLAGHINGNNKRSVILSHVSGPGPKAIKRSDIFKKDIVFCQEFLDEIYKKTAGKIVYSGEWHYHPSRNNNPSGLDLSSLEQISNQNEYLLDEPIMIIFNNKGELSCTAHPASKSYYKTKCLIEQ
jgi:integrative and conjugative element protein (TIGR02256 family)